MYGHHEYRTFLGHSPCSRRVQDAVREDERAEEESVPAGDETTPHDSDITS